jgi:hypothetical protein
MDNIYDAIKSGKTNEEIINKFCEQLNEARAQYNKEQAEIKRKQQEEDKKRQDKLTSARYYVVDDFADYLELLFPEYTTDRAETEDMIERTLLEFEDNFTSLDKTIKAINEIFNNIWSNNTKEDTNTNPNINNNATTKKENTHQSYKQDKDLKIISDFVNHILHI